MCNFHASAINVQELVSDGVTVLEEPVCSDSKDISTHAYPIQKNLPKVLLGANVKLTISSGKEKCTHKSPTTKCDSRGMVDKDIFLSTSENNVRTIQDSIDFSLSTEKCMSDQDNRDVLFEAGHSITEIEEIVAARADLDGVEDSLNSTITADSDVSLSDSVALNAFDALKEIRVKNVDKVVIGTLNINSLAPKFDQLSEVIGKNLDILIIQETKLDSSFPSQQLALAGFSEPYRLDRNREGGGVLVYVREDIPSKQLTKHSFSKNVEGLFLEINLRKTKLLLFGGYRSDHEIYGLSKRDFLEQVSFALDKYSSYERILLAGDFNIDREEEILEEFLFEQNLNNLVKEKTCFKSMENPSCIDLFLTNSALSFQNTTTVETGLSDFHKMVVTVMKTTFPKAGPQIHYYRDYKNFDLYNFRTDLRQELGKTSEKDYLNFEITFLKVLERHAPMKKKVLRANNKPYMTKALRKAIMRRSALKTKFLKNRRDEDHKAFKFSSVLVFRYLVFNVDLLIIAFLKAFVIYGLLFALKTFFFIGACCSNTLRNVISKFK